MRNAQQRYKSSLLGYTYFWEKSVERQFKDLLALIFWCKTVFDVFLVLKNWENIL